MSGIEFFAMAICTLIIACIYKKRVDKALTDLKEGTSTEITYGDILTKITSLIMFITALSFGIGEVLDNGFTETVISKSLPWAMLGIVIDNAKAIHRTLRPLLGSK